MPLTVCILLAKALTDDYRPKMHHCVCHPNWLFRQRHYRRLIFLTPSVDSLFGFMFDFHFQLLNAVIVVTSATTAAAAVIVTDIAALSLCNNASMAKYTPNAIYECKFYAIWCTWTSVYLYMSMTRISPWVALTYTGRCALELACSHIHRNDNNAMTRQYM